MADESQYTIVATDTLTWPESLKVPSPRFRLLVAADTADASVAQISRFAETALSKGMVYFCAWGVGCERFHDIVDELVVEDAVLGKARFEPPTSKDVVMTTWHDGESLEEALDFLATSAMPSEGYAHDSSHRVVICIGHPEWAETAHRFFKAVTNLH